MSQIEYKKVKIHEICTPAKADKTLTRSKAKDKEGNYPVYAATVGEVFAYVNDYNNTQPCLVVVNDGDAGNTYIVNDEKYTIGKHATGLIPNSGIDLIYLQKVATPIFQNIAKGYGLGNLPKTDILNAEVNIPIKNGKYDIQLQQELSKVYFQIEEQRQHLLTRIAELNEISVLLSESKDVIWEHVELEKVFKSILRGNSKYTKTYCRENSGNYAVYSADNEKPLGYMNIYDYDGEFLTISINGLAGKITIFNERFSTNADRVVCVPENGIDIHYVMYVAEPILRNKNKGRKGDLGKNEFTKLTPDMIKSTKIPIPMTKDNKFDLEKQIELSAKYEKIKTIKDELVKRITELTDIVIFPGSIF